MKERSIQRVGYAALLAFVVFVAAAAYFTDKREAKERASCEAVGGQLIRAVSPMYACVPRLKPKP